MWCCQRQNASLANVTWVSCSDLFAANCWNINAPIILQCLAIYSLLFTLWEYLMTMAEQWNNTCELSSFSQSKTFVHSYCSQKMFYRLKAWGWPVQIFGKVHSHRTSTTTTKYRWQSFWVQNAHKKPIWPFMHKRIMYDKLHDIQSDGKWSRIVVKAHFPPEKESCAKELH